MQSAETDFLGIESRRFFLVIRRVTGYFPPEIKPVDRPEFAFFTRSSSCFYEAIEAILYTGGEGNRSGTDVD